MKKSERLLNLLILLKTQRGSVSKARIRAALPDYAPLGDTAFERMFDRDKDELRALGVPIATDHLDVWCDEVGYRVRPDEFALPAIALTTAEAVLLGLATKVWQHPGPAGEVHDAVRKLVAAGAAVSAPADDIPVPGLAAPDPAFAVLWRCVVDRAVVSFEHRTGGVSPTRRRVVEPWGMLSSAGVWYLVGRDHHLGAERVFRLSRIVGVPTRRGAGDAYDTPAGIDLRAVLHRLRPVDERRTDATVLVRRGAGPQLRRTAVCVDDDVVGPDRGSSWDRLHLRDVAAVDLGDDVAALGADAVVEGPAWLRESVVRRLVQWLAA